MVQVVVGVVGLVVQIDVGLCECCYGGFEGLCYIEIEVCYLEVYCQWKVCELDFCYFVGECIVEIMCEFYDCLVVVVQCVLVLGCYCKVVIVIYGGVLECVYYWVSQIFFVQLCMFDIFNVSVNCLYWDGECVYICFWGEIGYFQWEMLDEVDCQLFIVLR